MKMLPRLQAEEKLDQVNVGTLASTDIDQGYRMRAIGQLQRKALGEKYRPAKASARDAAGMGIGVRVVTAKKAQGHV